MFKYLILGAILGANLFGATTVDDGSFGTIYDVFKSWIGGSLGLTVALLGMMGGVILYFIANLFTIASNGAFDITPKAFYIIFGSSIFAGALIGVVESMAGLGRATFG